MKNLVCPALAVFSLTTLIAAPLSAAGHPPANLSASDWSGIQAARAEWQRSFHETAGGQTVHRPDQGWRADFDRTGFVIASDDGAWQWGLESCAFGFADRLRALPQGGSESRVEGKRLTRTWDGNVQEWYANDPQGLEHGFTVSRRPEGGSAGVPLVFNLTIRGNLQPDTSTSGDGLTFRDAALRPALTYSGLKVWDADGHPVPARMSAPSSALLRIEVEETGARYPLTVDPIAAPEFLKPHNTNGGDKFGWAVAISGNTVVVGAELQDGNGRGVNPEDQIDNNNTGQAGAAYVFVRNGATWTQQAYLKAPPNPRGVTNSIADDHFGRSVAISVDTIVVGAYYENSSTKGVDTTPNEGATHAGAAYVFKRTNGNWLQQAYLKASNTAANDWFGWSVAVSGDIVAAGAPNEAGKSGAVYVFVRNGTTWAHEAYVKASNTGADDQFGYSVALSGNTLVAGAYDEDGGGTGAHAVQNDATDGSGAAYVFVRNGTTWAQQAYLKASNTDSKDEFGRSVAISENTIVCGAPGEDRNGVGVIPAHPADTQDSGAAYVYERTGTTWTLTAYLKASNPGAGDKMGTSVSVSGDLIVAGAPNEDGLGQRVNPVPDEASKDSGAAYVFLRSNGVWSPPAYLKASYTVNNTVTPPYIDSTVEDHFGTAVAVSGNTIVAGALDEDSFVKGINKPIDKNNDDTAASSGAAYLYTGFGPPLDTDADGISDDLEYFFGTPALEPGPSPLKVSSSGNLLFLEWPQWNPFSFPAATPEWSPDLITWLASGESRNGIPARTISVASTGTFSREATLDTSGLKRAFLRLTIPSP